RTRNGLVMVGTLADRRAFTRQAMQDLVFSDWSYAALITKDDLVTMCRQFAAVGAVPTSTGPPVAPGNACDVLANWDGRENLDSRRDRRSPRRLQCRLDDVGARPGPERGHRRVLVRAGGDVGVGVVPRHADHPHVLGVGEPGLAAPLRPDAAVQPEAVVARPV